MSPDTAAVVLAAGRGRRMGRGNKALLELNGEPLLARPLRTLRAAPSVGEIVLVMMPEDLSALRRSWGLDPAALGADRVVAGGAERWLSSRAGCEATGAQWDVLLVHDAARALVEAATVEAVAAAVRVHGAALAAVPLADTLKRVDAAGAVAATIERTGLWTAQTPQGARRDLLLAAFVAWSGPGLPTDEAMLLEAAGHSPAVVAASRRNLKITTAEDLELAEALLRSMRGAPR